MPANSHRTGQSDHRAIKVIEVVVALSVLIFLAWLLRPSLSGPRELQPRALCASNQRGIGQAEAIYSNDNQNSFPVHYFFGIDRSEEDDPAPATVAPAKPTPTPATEPLPMP